MEFIRRFDMRSITRKAFLDKLRELDEQARDYLHAPHVDRNYKTEGTDTVVTWIEGRQRGAPEMAQLASTLDAAVKQINGEKVMAGPVTGAKALGNMFRGHLADIKRQIDAAGQEMNIAMGDLKETAAQATEMVKAVKAETADLKQSLGLHSNNPPEDVDGA